MGLAGASRQVGRGDGGTVARHDGDTARLGDRFLRTGDNGSISNGQDGDHGRAPSRSPSTTAA
jgi:hypothetical protein